MALYGLIFSQSCSNVSNIEEIVISDGGSKDNTLSVIKNMSDTFPIPLRVVNSKPGNTRITVLPGLTWPMFFADYSLLVILIEKEITEMNLDIDCVIRYIFLNCTWSII